jgi:transposase
MAKALIIPVKEDIATLRKLLKSSLPLFVPRIRMLIEMKKEGEQGISKRELMSRIGASSQAIHNWRTSYKTGGLKALLSHNRKGFKPSVFTKEEHDKLYALLHDPQNNITGFVELREWVLEEFKKDIKYNTLLKYCVSNFGAKTKVARKSHINKDGEQVEAFKKTLVVSAEKP